MATLLIRADARNGMSEAQREALRHVDAHVSLGDPAVLVDESGVEWLAYDDGRFSLESAARGARIMANAASFPDFNPQGKSRGQIHAEDVRFAKENGVVLPGAIPHTEGRDRWEEVLEANGAPPYMRINIPPGFHVKVEEV